MEKFHNLKQDKQDGLLNAAMDVFSINGYKKTSIMDIATVAGVSKALIFHYFKNKKNLYLYLVNYCNQHITETVSNHFNPHESDFFKSLIQVQQIKFSVINRYPSIFDFLRSVYEEADPEISTELRKLIPSNSDSILENFFSLLDHSRFKDNVDIQKAMKIVTWCAEGFVRELPKGSRIDVNAASHQFEAYLNLLRSSFYKEEYL